jgi:DNA-binding PadR family transcriptional regulator
MLKISRTLAERRGGAATSAKRNAYELTDEGRQALLRWLRGTREGPTQFRDEGILRLFLADALPEEDQLALIQRLRQRAQDAGAHMREQILPLAQTLEQNDIRYPALVARLGADTYAYIEQWLTQLEDQGPDS